MRGSRARLRDRGQQRKKKDEQGSTRDLESPWLGQEEAQGDGDGLREKLGTPQARLEKESHTINFPEQKKRLRVMGSLKIQP